MLVIFGISFANLLAAGLRKFLAVVCRASNKSCSTALISSLYGDLNILIDVALFALLLH